MMHVPKKMPIGETDETVYSKPLQDKLEYMSRKERRDYIRNNGGFKHYKIERERMARRDQA